MLRRLRAIAAEHGIQGQALRDLEELFERSIPRVPTQREPSHGPGPAHAHAPPEPPGADDPQRYVVGQYVGRGGFAEVREVRDRHVERTVARKVQLPERSSPEDCARFRQEILVTARLQHPGVVPLYDWGELPDGRVWFTMKRVHGKTIARRIGGLHGLAGPPFLLELRRVLDEFRRLCEPVAYAHARRIIHRDLSPLNLMIGELGEVHVLDWGLARDLERGQDPAPAPGGVSPSIADDPSETALRTRIAGTPYYMPPEQARGDIQAMGPPSDVYTLGAVLYEILCGRPPYAPPRGLPAIPERILAEKASRPPAPLAAVARWAVPEELAAICERAMERDPRARYADAEALMKAVRDWLDDSDRQDRGRRIVADADREHRTRIEDMRARAEAMRRRARTLLAGLRDFDSAQDKAEGWKLDDDGRALEQEAMREEVYWTQKIRSALNVAPDLQEAHQALTDHYMARLLEAEADHDDPAAAQYHALLKDLPRHLRDDARRAHGEAVLRGDGRLTLVTDPPGARVVLSPYHAVDRYLTPDLDHALALVAPVRELPLARGSYLALLQAPGRRDVRYPVAIGRDEHWDGVRPGGAGPCPIRLLPEDELAADDVYVPAGWFVAGGDPSAGEALPRRRVWVDAFVIGRHPVTNTDYLAFLNDLVDEGRPEEALRRCPRQSRGATVSGEDRLAYAQGGAGRFALHDPEAEHALPVVFVDWRDAMAYAAHLARRTGLPWRLPSELEWEKAARGVDGRFMPWGDHVEPTWACGSGSHAERKRVMPVDTYPTDASPYGVRGMAGNVRDWCVERWRLDGPRVEDGVLRIDPAGDDDGDDRAIRGGAWTSLGDLARLAVRYAGAPGTRHGVLGFRLARSIVA
jgi:serine/threonine protein kinase/formylglycine-generating enzyme required for sulfatase activity